MLFTFLPAATQFLYPFKIYCLRSGNVPKRDVFGIFIVEIFYRVFHRTLLTLLTTSLNYCNPTSTLCRFVNHTKSYFKTERILPIKNG